MISGPNIEIIADFFGFICSFTEIFIDARIKDISIFLTLNNFKAKKCPISCKKIAIKEIKNNPVLSNSASNVLQTENEKDILTLLFPTKNESKCYSPPA